MGSEHHAAADQAMAHGDFPGAVRSLEQGAAADPQDFDAWMKLAALRRRGGDLAGALAAANAALDARPNEFIALLLKGSLHEAMGDAGRAAEVYRAALFHAEGRTDLLPPLLQQLDRARGLLERYRRDVEHSMTGLAQLEPRHAARARRFLDNVLDRRPIYHQAPTHYHYPGLPDVEFFDFDYIELKQRLRDAFPAIKAELQGLLAARPERQQPYVDFESGQPMAQFAPLNRNPDWNAFHLIRYGEVDAELTAACPATMAAIMGGGQPDIAGLTPNLMFSLLAPHTRIPAHVGVANFRVVFHLPLIIPGQCFFRVGSETREWIEGEPWVFDDSIDHEAWNDSDQLRVILMGDLWRPELDAGDRQVIRELINAQAFNSDLGAL
ncbi:aspartyl/asparaginyl beta-hydroxylase domain-containing protein [Novosphingobium sp.]|uniref:aspartyl/asparaginyl beta-hydroxylase domain-containing protein n=1 Tax=Novosphingobium sp. TaxID=1874826 RepID=UPI0025FED0FD|nr:aspartyl/asparaginyl beta-hydroxylase domain-containing protein [Novosphingobium sp.]MCC6927225.1 aspartyl/asparaginyl beta-hydroxylase domain-containing protein [Novosphingobium sp.]